MSIDKDVWLLRMAQLVGTRSTCHRLAVGCVLTNARGHVLSTGYNGRASGLPHCAGGGGFKCNNSDAPVGQPNGCEAIHAEQNALLQCRDVYDITTCYVTHSPCLVCVKLLMNTSCKRIVFKHDYPHADAKRLWLETGRQWIQLNTTDLAAVVLE